MKTIVTSKTTLENVTQIMRRGVGPVFRAIIDLSSLHHVLQKSTVLYAPKYQRGFKLSSGDIDIGKYDQLYPINSNDLQIEEKRSQSIAVKYLQGRLYTCELVWNARMEEGVKLPTYDKKNQTLDIHSSITIPDTGHRHRGYFTLVEWKQNLNKIPDVVEVDGSEITRDEIEYLLDDFDPEEEQVYLSIYQLPPEREGYLYDEFNSDNRAPSNAVAQALNPTKTPARRFVKNLMDYCPVFGPDEIEERRNLIGSESRKLVPNATLAAAAKQIEGDLIKLEASKDGSYDDFIQFTCSMFDEWSYHYPAFLPGADMHSRQDLRKQSFALANIIFHPLFRLAHEYWSEYHKISRDWKTDTIWRDKIAKIAGKTTSSGGAWTGHVLDKDNPAWQGKILIETRDDQGNISGWSLSSTRQTREAAFKYLKQIAGPLTLPSKTSAAA